MTKSNIKFLAQKYLEITAEHGPSAALIAFINPEGSLEQEIGLENFSTFSASTQHELLALHLKNIAESEVEVEGDGGTTFVTDEADMIQTYIKVTEEHGPDLQLLAFVNYDNSLGEEIGLEGFENLGVVAQHEILLNKLTLKAESPEVVDSAEEITDKPNATASFDEQMRDAQMAQAYIDITAEMGPSAQLIAFIDHDKTLEADIGLEGFHAYSLQARHEILLSKLNPDAMKEAALEGLIDDAIATEGLVDFCVKYRRWLLIGFIIPIPLFWIGAIIGYVNKPRAVLNYTKYASVSNKLEDLVKVLANILSGTPTAAKGTGWEKVGKLAEDNLDPAKEIWASDGNIQLTKFEQSGWTAERFTTEVKDLDTLSKKLEKIVEDYAAKVSKIENTAGDGENTAQAATALKQISQFQRELKKAAATVHGYLGAVSKNMRFEK